MLFHLLVDVTGQVADTAVGPLVGKGAVPIIVVHVTRAIFSMMIYLIVHSKVVPQLVGNSL